MELLEQFNPEDVKLIDENNADKKYLSKELENIENGTVEFISLEALEERIWKYENKNPYKFF